MASGQQGGWPSCWHRTKQPNEAFLSLSGHTVRYVGPGKDDSHAASVRATAPAGQQGPVCFFEVTVLDKGQHGFIGVGFVQADFQISRLPGWPPHSYGYHGDDGKAFGSDARGRPYGPTFTTGDVIGAACNLTARTITYYKNGQNLGVAFSDVQEEQLYPCVGLRTSGEEVWVNFGSSPFKADVLDVCSHGSGPAAPCV